MAKPRLALVPDAPKTVLERFAEMADQEYERAEALAKRVTMLEAEAHPRLAEISDLKVQLREVRAQYLLLRAACRNVLAAHESGDEALLDEALARMEEIASGEASTSESLRGGTARDA
jgi:bacterioferritin (cytochrome b1)